MTPLPHRYGLRRLNDLPGDSALPRVTCLAAGLVLLVIGPGQVRAQNAAAAIPVISQPVVQALPDRDGFALNEALTRLGRNPRDVDALVDAGNAALDMGDVDAATGFLKRAIQIAPGDARAKAGLASALVRSGNPLGAIPLFVEAEKAGPLDVSRAADRGLAYDLVGDNASAQLHYRQALARKPDDEVSRRLALSLAISGDKRGAEAALLPQLRQQDKSAWRTRAFALAIYGETEQAVSIARTILPAELATAITPYLRYMPRLTPAQQAAAANFGTFPLPSEIGRDDPRIARHAPAGGARARVASADAALVPAGEPLGAKERPRRERRAKRGQEQTRVAPPEVVVGVRSAEAVPASGPSPAAVPVRTAAAPVRVAAAPAPPPQPAARTPAPAPVPPARAATPPVAPAPALAAVPASTQASFTPATGSMSGPVQPSRVPAPGFDLASIADKGARPATVPAPVPAPAASPPSPAPVAAPAPPPAPDRPSLAAAFADFSSPTTDARPAAGAVDIRRIAPARARPKGAESAERARPAPPSHPSRIWVQVATGREKGALSFDWRRMTQQAKDALKGKQGYTSAWGQTNRLLTGPFASEAAASAFMTQLRRAGIDGPFLWTSPAGQVVDALARK